MRLAEQHKQRVHVLHVSTADEMAFLADHKDWASVEVTPHHLTLVAPDCYERLGTYAQMNPPVRDEAHRARDLGGARRPASSTCWAPTTRRTRARRRTTPIPASHSGMTGVQTLVPIMLDHVNAGRLTLAALRRPDQRRPAAALRHPRQGPHRGGLRRRSHHRRPEAQRDHHQRLDRERAAAGRPTTARRCTGWPVGTSCAAAASMWDGRDRGPGRTAPPSASTKASWITAAYA